MKKQGNILPLTVITLFPEIHNILTLMESFILFISKYGNELISFTKINGQNKLIRLIRVQRIYLLPAITIALHVVDMRYH